MGCPAPRGAAQTIKGRVRMEKTQKTATIRASRKRKLWSDLLRDRQLYLLMLLPMAYLIVFSYLPMYGVQIAFRDYKPLTGITGSEWLGLKHFSVFMGTYNFRSILWNTLALSLYQMAAGFPVPILLALIFNSLPSKRLMKTVQSVAYMPHFISIVVVVSILNLVFNPVNGVYGYVFHLLGGIGYPMDFRGRPETFRHLYVWSDIWQNMGWDTVVYTAALSSVSPDLHEAAMLDGASRWQMMIHITLPSIIPTICVMLILRCGSLMGVGYEKVFLMQNDLNISASEVISTYVYKSGLINSEYGFSTAVGLFNSVINCILLVSVNMITRKVSEGEVRLF